MQGHIIQLIASSVLSLYSHNFKDSNGTPLRRMKRRSLLVFCWCMFIFWNPDLSLWILFTAPSTMPASFLWRPQWYAMLCLWLKADYRFGISPLLFNYFPCWNKHQCLTQLSNSHCLPNLGKNLCVDGAFVLQDTFLFLYLTWTSK